MPRAHPILFTPENVRAILQGRKTQTRRIVKLTDSGRIKKPGSPKNWHPDDANAVQACPYGMPGDRLWVRETWAWPGEEQVLYKANPDDAALVERWKTDPNCPQVKWTPSIHMPKKFCRLWLELTSVRVERLQEISEADAIAEGVKVCPNMNGRPGATGYVWPGSPYDLSGLCHSSAITAFSQGWESINGEGSWDANPWVWVMTFKRVGP